MGKGIDHNHRENIFQNRTPSLANFYAEEMVQSGENRDYLFPLQAALAGEYYLYENVEFIGQGGMKLVVQADDLTTGRKVAIAMFRNDIDADEELVEQFLREARITAALQHPNIMPVYDLGLEDGDYPYFVMKLIEGDNLAQILKELTKQNPVYLKRYPLAVLLDIYLKVCDAIAYAHSKNIIHLDLKPDNIQVGEYGEVMVCDWGLSKVLGQKNIKATQHEIGDLDSAILNQITVSGTIKGTPGYMAPEQVKTRFGSKRKRTDIYALGGVLYSILTLRPPITGPSLQHILDSTTAGTIPTPHERSPQLEIPLSLEAVTMKALSLKPEQRYSRVREISREINAYLMGFATKAEEAGFIKAFLMLMKRHKSVAGMIIVTFALTVTMLVKVMHSEQSAVQQRRIAEKSTMEAKANAEKTQKTLQLLTKEREEKRLLGLAAVPENVKRLRNKFIFLSNEEGMSLINTILEYQPENKTALHYKGLALFIRHEFTKADQCFRRSGLLSLSSYGATGDYLTLDGTDDYIETAAIAAIQGAANITAEAWIKTTSTADYKVITEFGASGTRERFTFVVNGSKLRLEVNGTGITGATVVSDGKWHHVAASIDAAGEVVLYVDGVVDATASFGVCNFGTSDVRIGHGPFKTNYFPGEMDEVRLWGTVLTQPLLDVVRMGEIENNAGTAKMIDGADVSGLNWSNLQAYYKMDNDGASLNDSSANDRDATLTGSPVEVGAPGNALVSPNDAATYFTSGNLCASLNRTNFSFEGWVNFNSNVTRQEVFYDDSTVDVNDDSTNYALGMVYNAGTLEARVSKGSDRFGSVAVDLTDGWHHVAMAYDGAGSTNADKLKVYVDGVEQSLTYSGTLPVEAFKNGASNLVIGQSADASFDEFRFWATTRTEQEIRDNRFKNISSANADLLRYFRFDTASGASIVDHSANGIHGILENDLVTPNPLTWAASKAPLTSMQGLTDYAAVINRVGGMDAAELMINSNISSGLTIDDLTNGPDTVVFGRFDDTSGMSTNDVLAPIDQRLAGVWYMNNPLEGDGTVELIFDLTTNDDISSGVFKLLNRTTASGMFSPVGLAGTVGGSAGAWTVTFTGVAVSEGYYSLGEEGTLLTPAYGVEVVKDGDLLNWSADYEDGVVSYKIQKLVDGVWTTVTAVAAKGGADTSYSVTVGEGEFRIVAVDATGYEQPFGATTDAVVTAFIEVKEGWNLISVPCDNADTSGLNDFGTIWGWNGSEYVTVDTPTAMQGLWIYAQTASELTLTGKKVTDATVTLHNGWNLIGPAENCSAPADLQTFTWNGAYQSILEQDNTLIMGQGYWVYSDSEQAVELK